MGLQKDMMIMMLSMLEGNISHKPMAREKLTISKWGRPCAPIMITRDMCTNNYYTRYVHSYIVENISGNVMNGPIGKQMVDTLVESSQNFEVSRLRIWEIGNCFNFYYFDLFYKFMEHSTPYINNHMFCLQMLLKFFDIFLKMKDLSTSEAFAVSYCNTTIF